MARCGLCFAQTPVLKAGMANVLVAADLWLGLDRLGVGYGERLSSRCTD